MLFNLPCAINFFIISFLSFLFIFSLTKLCGGRGARAAALNQNFIGHNKFVAGLVMQPRTVDMALTYHSTGQLAGPTGPAPVNAPEMWPGHHGQ